MPERVGSVEQLTVHQAAHRLAVLSAWTHYEATRPVQRRVYALMDAHKALNAPARKAYGDAVKLLGELGELEDALEWVRTHNGYAGVWPHAEREDMRAAVRAVAPE